jgi:hypothetical protein
MGYDLISVTWPTARKDHRCIWCGETIEKGLQYKHEISKYEDVLQDHKWHTECVEAAEYAFQFDEEFIVYENERPVVTDGGANARPIDTAMQREGDGTQ